jgi:hypothetical protein
MFGRDGFPAPSFGSFADAFPAPSFGGMPNPFQARFGDRSGDGFGASSSSSFSVPSFGTSSQPQHNNSPFGSATTPIPKHKPEFQCALCAYRSSSEALHNQPTFGSTFGSFSGANPYGNMSSKIDQKKFPLFQACSFYFPQLLFDADVSSEGLKTIETLLEAASMPRNEIKEENIMFMDLFYGAVWKRLQTDSYVHAIKDAVCLVWKHSTTKFQCDLTRALCMEIDGMMAIQKEKQPHAQED